VLRDAVSRVHTYMDWSSTPRSSPSAPPDTFSFGCSPLKMLGLSLLKTNCKLYAGSLGSYLQ